MAADVLGLDARTYEPHPLHGPGRVWSETNCAADMWIEALHAMGLDPVGGLGFVLASDFDGEQWRMFTFPAETLERLYGIAVDELNVWRPLRHHVAEQLALGHLVAFDVDAWWLPDTAGLTYRSAHQKTTVLATMIDTGARRLGYLHNAGYYTLEGEDFDAVLPASADPAVLPPFTLQVRVGHRHPPGCVGSAVTRADAARHLGRRADGNPVSRMAARLAADLEVLAAEGLDTYHRWAFGTLRQCGANAELAADLCDRLAEGGLPTEQAREDFLAVAAAAKAAELVLARAVRGRAVDVAGVCGPLAERWASAMGVLAGVLAPAGLDPSGPHREEVAA